MKILVVFAAFLLAVSALSDKEEWVMFKENHVRQFRSLREEHRRFAIFQSNLRTIEAHNELYDKGEKTWYMGVTQFSDMTPQEFTSMLNSSFNAKPDFEGPVVLHKESGDELPESVNWVDKGVVTEVKDQGKCGVTWAFSATGAVESAYALKHGTLMTLSEQNLLDCSLRDNHGCDSGWPTAAFQYMKENGIERESDYPYTEVQGSCQFDSSKNAAKVSGIMILNKKQESHLDAIANVGPISIGVSADEFQHYKGGVLIDTYCRLKYLNLRVLAVGYGTTENGMNYWLLKNSWGQQWGESGYIKYYRTEYYERCVTTDSSYPIVE